MATSRDEYWHPVRFLETLDFFGEVPFVGSFRWLQILLGAMQNPKAPRPSALQVAPGAALVSIDPAQLDDLAAIVEQQGFAVRSLVGLPSPSSSSPQSAGIINTQTILWAGVPKDEDNLKAHIQAIKTNTASEEAALFDFRSNQACSWGEVWGAVDDVVMGGASNSGLNLQPEYARFAGVVSTANSGGFASVRTLNFEPPFQLQDWHGIRLAIRGDGQRYKFILRNSSNWDGLAYCAAVNTAKGCWSSVDVPFAAVIPTFRARTQPTAPPLDARSICSFQFMLSKFEYDGAKNPQFQPGVFALDIESLKVYRSVPMPSLIAIASSAAQVKTYTELLTGSGLSHQVLDSSDSAQFHHALTANLTAINRRK